MKSLLIALLVLIAAAAQVKALQTPQPCGSASSPVDPPQNQPNGYTTGEGECVHVTSGDAADAAESEMLIRLFGACQVCPPLPGEPCLSFGNYSGGLPEFGVQTCGTKYKSTFSIPPGVKVIRTCAGC